MEEQQIRKEIYDTLRVPVSLREALSCETCQRLGVLMLRYQDLVNRPGRFKPIQNIEDISLGSFEQMSKRTTCPTCCLIVRCAINRKYHWTPKSELRLKSFFMSNFHIENDSPPYSSFSFLPLKCTSRQKYRLMLDPQWIDVGRGKKWIEYCNQCHGEECGSLARKLQLQLPPEMNLIDLQRQCLVSASPDLRYTALSYVWGQSITLPTRKSNFAALQQEGALSVANEAIPETIRDAMRLTLQLGERYIWVDALCIIQDDDEIKSIQLDNMPSIYANANLTIIAAQGESANHGLRGVGEGHGSGHFASFQREP